MPAPFTTLGELRVARTLEEDAVLPLLEAVHPDGRVLFVRALPLPSALSADAVASFEASVRAASALEHPSVAAPRVWSASPPFVAVDPIDGVRLAVLADAPMSADRVVAVGADLAEALEAAHAAHAVHAGVSIRAVTIAREGRAVLSDFGIAGLAAALVNEHSHVLESVSAHLTPEQLESTPTTAATDVFSLGATLYRLLTGLSPFDAPSPMGMTLKLSMGAYERLDEVVPDAPAPLRDLVHRMLASAPRDRPSARDVAIALLELAPREPARRETLRRMLPPPTSAAAPPVDVTSPAIAPSPAALAAVQPAAPPMAVVHQVPPTASATPPAETPPVEGPTQWIESARFDDAATEYTPELETAIARDAGISTMPVLAPSTRTAARISSTPITPTRSPGREERSVAFYAAIAVAALVILVGAVLGAIALVD